MGNAGGETGRATMVTMVPAAGSRRNRVSLETLGTPTQECGMGGWVRAPGCSALHSLPLLLILLQTDHSPHSDLLCPSVSTRA